MYVQGLGAKHAKTPFKIKRAWTIWLFRKRFLKYQFTSLLVCHSVAQFFSQPSMELSSKSFNPRKVASVYEGDALSILTTQVVVISEKMDNIGVSAS
ncbi:hypothetical protein IEQ34_009708 [Dendrobium chrysotoxum]|uniref:Uncharacterized protein n=1 Tax=Dendrobium chrysotoxum TaxID=161865 RepID=A0AAV7H2B2_DENCH|nr:hypothetical protein IEQ34_009708 [Dendrobium chrysotoxum]